MGVTDSVHFKINGYVVLDIFYNTLNHIRKQYKHELLAWDLTDSFVKFCNLWTNGFKYAGKQSKT